MRYTISSSDKKNTRFKRTEALESKWPSVKTSSGEINKEQLSEIIKQSFSTDKKIGRKGGTIEFLGCRVEFPPIKQKTIVKITIRSIYDDAPAGYIVVSPEIECSTSGITLKSYIVISLPVHAMPRDHAFAVMTKKHQDAKWEFIDVKPIVVGRRVTFEVPHFCVFKTFARLVPWLSTHLCHNLFYKASTSQLLGVTCLDDEAVKEGCLENLRNEGFQAASPLPELFALCLDDEMSYQYSCLSPGRSVVQPSGKVVFNKYNFKSTPYVSRAFMLQPLPEEDVNLVSLQYFLSTPQRGKVENRIGLKWNQTATPQTPPQYGDAPYSANITSARERAAAAGRDIYAYIVYNICQAESIIIWVLIAILACCLVAVYFSQYK